MKLKAHVSHVWTGGKACRELVSPKDPDRTQAMVCKRPGNNKLWCVDVYHQDVRQTDAMRCRQGMKAAVDLAHELFQEIPEGGAA